MSLLAGFDLVYAVTQQTINKQLQLLAVESVLPSKWQYQHPENKFGIDADLGIPVVDMNTGDASSRKVLVHFPLNGGKINYLTIDVEKFTIVPKSANVVGWQLTLTINLSLAEIAAKLISEHKKIPSAVKQQLTAFTEDLYEISHLFLNFEDADLVESYQLTAPNNTDMNDPNVINQVKNIVQSLLNTLKGSDNPFIFGYTVNNKKPPASNADFIPTGTTYSVYPEPAHLPRSTINFLSVTNGRKVPGVGYGIFTHNWVTTDDVQGAFVVAQNILMSKILPPLAEIMDAKASDFKPSGTRLTLTKPNDRGGHITCTVTPMGGTNQILADFYSDFDQDVHDKAGSKVGNVTGYMKWTTTISFGFDKQNNLSVSVVNSPVEQSHTNHLNALGQFEKVLAIFGDAIIKIFSFGFAPNVFEDLIQDDWKFNINADLSVITADMKTRLVLPAGSEFFFKDAIMSSQGHLTMTTTIRN
ncbi:hypothetical protein STA3757_48910 (plasmid) [Stanieria sp. NIES-3757]|nr:hypothetical protein STA3757_48910 [Stanieria sp. NIES-3757]